MYVPKSSSNTKFVAEPLLDSINVVVYCHKKVFVHYVLIVTN